MRMCVCVVVCVCVVCVCVCACVRACISSEDSAGLHPVVRDRVARQGYIARGISPGVYRQGYVAANTVWMWSHIGRGGGALQHPIMMPQRGGRAHACDICITLCSVSKQYWNCGMHRNSSGCTDAKGRKRPQDNFHTATPAQSRDVVAQAGTGTGKGTGTGTDTGIMHKPNQYQN